MQEDVRSHVYLLQVLLEVQATDAHMHPQQVLEALLRAWELCQHLVQAVGLQLLEHVLP